MQYDRGPVEGLGQMVGFREGRPRGTAKGRGGLHPTPHRGLLPKAVQAERRFQVAFFAGASAIVHERGLCSRRSPVGNQAQVLVGP